MRKKFLQKIEPCLYGVFCALVGFWIFSFLLTMQQEQELEKARREAPVVTVQAIQGPVEQELEPEPEEDEEIPGMDVDKPAMVARYSDVDMTEEERREFAAVVYLEAGNQTAEGQQAVAEVILNRVISDDFPGTVYDVLHQGEGTSTPQFSTVDGIDTAEPPQAAYDAIDAALYGESILPDDVVYFSRNGENDRVWGKIGAHVFCYGYEW